MRKALVGLMPFGLLAGLLMICVPAAAHHGTSNYDQGKTVTLSGVVTGFVWSNPHVQVYFTLKNDKGEEQTWGIETVSPGNALGNGWTKSTFKAGDEVLVSFVPAKGDRFFGNCPQIVFVADGKRLGGRGTCGGGAVEAVADMSKLPVKPGYTKVEVKMPKDDGKRPASLQEK